MYSNYVCLINTYGRITAFTAQNAVISPNFLAWKFVERYSFRIDLGKSPETMRKLCLSTKFPHQKIRCSYGILRSASYADLEHLFA